VEDLITAIKNLEGEIEAKPHPTIVEELDEVDKFPSEDEPDENNISIVEPKDPRQRGLRSSVPRPKRNVKGWKPRSSVGGNRDLRKGGSVRSKRNSKGWTPKTINVILREMRNLGIRERKRYVRRSTDYRKENRDRRKEEEGKYLTDIAARKRKRDARRQKYLAEVDALKAKTDKEKRDKRIEAANLRKRSEDEQAREQKALVDARKAERKADRADRDKRVEAARRFKADRAREQRELRNQNRELQKELCRDLRRSRRSRNRASKSKSIRHCGLGGYGRRGKKRKTKSLDERIQVAAENTKRFAKIKAKHRRQRGAGPTSSNDAKDS